MRWPEVLTAFVALAVAVPALAQDRPDVGTDGALRPDMPAANARQFAPPVAGPQEAFAAFAAWNQREGNPRLLLLWNRELSDDTTTRYKDRSSGVIATAVLPGGTVTAYDGEREQQRTTGGKHSPLGRHGSLDLESGFIDAFLSSGANVIDRNALMRKISTQHSGADRSDQQFIEASALEQGVDYLVEVLPDFSSSPTGYLFTVKITHLPTSKVHAQFRTTGLPTSGPMRLVARPGGYVRESVTRNTPEFVAETLAAETMKRFR